MSDRGVQTAAAEAAVSYLEGLSPELRGCAILDSEGTVLAASGTIKDRWRDAANDFLASADAAEGEPAAYAHVATADGEVFCVRHEGYSAFAVTDRFVLASLTVFDLRAALRDLVAAVSAPA